MTTELSKRKDIADRVESRLQELAVYKTLESVHLYWFVKNSVLGIEATESIINPSDRFFNLFKWYVKIKQQKPNLPEETQTDSVETVSG